MLVESACLKMWALDPARGKKNQGHFSLCPKPRQKGLRNVYSHSIGVYRLVALLRATNVPAESMAACQVLQRHFCWRTRVVVPGNPFSACRRLRGGTPPKLSTHVTSHCSSCQIWEFCVNSRSTTGSQTPDSKEE